MNIHVSGYGFAYTCAVPMEARRGLWCSLELKLIGMSYLMWLLETELRSSAGAIHALNLGAISLDRYLPTNLNLNSQVPRKCWCVGSCTGAIHSPLNGTLADSVYFACNILCNSGSSGLILRTTVYSLQAVELLSWVTVHSVHQSIQGVITAHCTVELMLKKSLLSITAVPVSSTVSGTWLTHISYSAFFVAIIEYQRLGYL